MQAASWNHNPTWLQHSSNMAPTWRNMAKHCPKMAQQGPQGDMPSTNPNMAHLWLLGSTWPSMAPMWPPLASYLSLGLGTHRNDRRKFRSRASFGQMEKQTEMGRAREEQRREDTEKRKSKKKEDAGVRKGSKVAKHCVFQMICGSGESNSRLAKAAGAEPSGQMRDEKLHAAVARSTFPSQNAQNTPCSDHFWKLRCRESARCCGAKHISK